MRRALFALLLLSGLLTQSCVGGYHIDGPGGRQCKAFCRTPSEDGTGCVEWASDASDACVGRLHPTYQCCSTAGRCQMGIAGARLAPCSCAFATPYGVQMFPGQGC